VNLETTIENLEREWDLESGFIGLLRGGTFDKAALARFVSVLEQIELPTERVIDRRLVSLLWLVPLMMEWQIQRFSERGTPPPELVQGQNQIQSLIWTVLGTP